MVKKISSAVICFCMVLGLIFSAPVVFAADINQGVIEIDTVEGITGDTVVVPIKITQNPGIMAVTVSVTYDPDVLKYAGFYYGDIFTDYTIAVHPDRRLIRLVICERRNKTNDGTIVSFKFKIADNAKAELTKIGLEYGKGDFCDWDLNKIMPQIVPGGINVAFNGKNCTHKSYGEWKVVSEPVCEEVGISERVCKQCGHKELKETAAIGHTYSDSWTVDKPATAEAEGTMSRYCIRCDDYVDRVNFSLEQSESSGIKNEIWQDITDNKVGEELFKEQNPDKELTPNEHPADQKNEDNNSNILNADDIINSILPDGDDSSESDVPSVTEKIEEVIPEYRTLFDVFKIAFAVLVLLIIL